MKEVVIKDKTLLMMPELPRARTPPRSRDNLCRGCYFWDGSCNADGGLGNLTEAEVCGNSKSIYIETTEEAMAQYVAAKLES
jgi:hypothetical protein